MRSMSSTLWIIATAWLGCFAIVLQLAEHAPTFEEVEFDSTL